LTPWVGKVTSNCVWVKVANKPYFGSRRSSAGDSVTVAQIPAICGEDQVLLRSDL